MTAFRAPRISFSGLDPASIAMLVAGAADIALVLDDAGIIKDVSIANPELANRLGQTQLWIDEAWPGLLAIPSRAKAALVLADAVAGRTGRWVHLNHAAADGVDLPVLYAATELQRGRIVMLGRDLRPISALQQRLIDAQTAMERDHARMRQLELRYRTLLHTSGEPMVMLDAATLRISDANPAADALLGRTGSAVGAPDALIDRFASEDRPRLQALFAATRAANPHEAVPASLADGRRVIVRTLAFREEQASQILVRLAIDDDASSTVEATPTQPALLQLVDSSPDGFVVTDGAGRLLAANAAFAALVDVTRPRDLTGQSLDRWLGHGAADLDVLLTNLRRGGVVRLFATALTSSTGLATSVELSAVALPQSADGAAFGFTIRDITRRMPDAASGRELPRSIDQLTELIGRVTLKDLVREATDMIERLCIEAALEKTNDNRASAAELLGLSRQSLYVKLHRYGLGDLADVPA